MYFYDKGGLQTDRLSEFAFKPVWQWCLRREADVYFINIGGNDITKTSEPEAIYQRIVDLVDQLYSRPRVQLVYVGEIWLWPFLGNLFLLVQTRGDFRHGLSKEEFSLYSTISYLIMVVWGIFRVVWGGLGNFGVFWGGLGVLGWFGVFLWTGVKYLTSKIAVCFLWLSLPGDYRVTDEALLAETT